MLIPTIHSLISKKFLISINVSLTPYSLAALFQQAIQNCSITIIKNDELDIHSLQPHLPYFDAVVIGPGPGSPDNPEDIGLVKDLWKLRDDDLLPIFGVCLGLQSLAIENGAYLKRLPVVKHGQISTIHHVSTDLFENIGPTKAVRYHSLHVELNKNGVIEDLAWADDEENGQVVMAIKHSSRPFWAVQYHPESVCTDQGGLGVVRNFWHLSKKWCTRVGRFTLPWSSELGSKFGILWPYVSSIPAVTKRPTGVLNVISTIIHRHDLSIIDVSEALGASHEPSRFVLLESAAEPGRFSIVASLTPSSLQIQYHVGDPCVSIHQEGQTSYEPLEASDIWSWFSEFMKSKTAVNGVSDVPFWGGLVGFLSYELGVNSLHIPCRRDVRAIGGRHPDVDLIFVERSIVMDSRTGSIYVQSIKPNDHLWVEETRVLLQILAPPPSADLILPQGKPDITLPNKSLYLSRIHHAKEHLAAGDSYELCLTAQTRVLIPSSRSQKNVSSSWERYKRLRKSNPAPHSAYIRLHPSTLMSSSPERFLSYTRPPGTLCQLRPIKGTVRKAPHITRAVAEKALIGSPKEVAENLMIVDLIRHDLHGFVGQDVQVKQFCSVEEYETVWQLVSVIEGKLSYNAPRAVENQLGWEVLQRSLPPGAPSFLCVYSVPHLHPTGSMTGAPKKRSVEILQTLEDHQRSIYSGVFGYWCVGGSGDWSVTIRSCFKFEEREIVDAQEKPGVEQTEEWLIGAGGAITALSDPEAEWEEMEMKLNSVLRAFGVLSS